jgi:uncharacterized protein YoxC
MMTNWRDRMIIVYASLAVIAISIVYFIISAIKTLKEAQPSIDRLNETNSRLQQKANMLKGETDALKVQQQKLQSDFQFKKGVFTSLISSVKETPKSITKWWKIKIPFIHKL